MLKTTKKSVTCTKITQVYAFYNTANIQLNSK